MLACGAVAATAAPARAQASLGKAKELYAAASYDEALVMLNTLGSSSEESDAAAIAMYRVLCLVAVGRTVEVDTAIDRLVAPAPVVSAALGRDVSAYTESGQLGAGSPAAIDGPEAVRREQIGIRPR
jgi:hypothetical protein